MMKSDEDVKIYFVTIPAHNLCTSKIMKAWVLGFLAEAESDSRPGYGYGLRTTGQHQRKAR